MIHDYIVRPWNSAKLFLQGRQKLQIFLVFAMFFTVFFAVYFSVSTLSSSDDHFFHFRFAQQMTENGFFHSFTDFKSIYFSKMAQGNQYFVYYNFLFFLLIIPFALITPLSLGIKLYAVFAVAFAFTLLYYCLKKIEIRNPLVWTVLVLAITNTSSIWRFFLSRPYALAPSLLVLLMVFLYRRNRIGIFAVSFIYLYWHSATFFLPVCVSIGYLIIEKFYRTKGDYKNLLACLGGTLAAFALTFVVSNGLFAYMKDIIFGTYIDTIISKKVPIGEGGELYPMDFFNFVQGNALIFAAFVTTFAVDIFNYVGFKMKKIASADYFSVFSQSRKILQTTVLVLTALFFLGTVAASQRFGDYFTFFAAFYIALSIDYMRRSISVSGSRIMIRGISVGLCIVLAYLFVSNMLFLQSRLGQSASDLNFYQVGQWLNRNTKSGDLVYNANWSWFPQLYYYSPKDDYFTGLEPRFMYVFDDKKYWISVHMAADGYVCDQAACPDMQAEKEKNLALSSTTLSWAKKQGDAIAHELVDNFNTHYIVSSRDYTVFDYIMDHNPRFKSQIYNAEFGTYVYKVE